MLSYDFSLLFPRLRRLGECLLIRKADPAEQPPASRGLFQLDWQGIDAIKLDQHVHWASEQHPGKNLPFSPTLPKILDDTVKNQFFALDDHYIRAIRMHSRLAREIWSTRFSMDTMARERAMEPAEALVWAAFWLLSDCAYDPEAQYYIRTPTKIILPHAMAWKFWQGQTGRGLLWRKARIDDLEDRRGRIINDSPVLGDMIDDFVHRMKEHEREHDQAYSALTADKLEAAKNQPAICSPPETHDVAPGVDS